MDTRVLAWREATPGSTIACLRDADLDCQWPRDKDRPQSWNKNTAGGQSVNLGWLWSRTEIENYLFDPNVVAAALGLDALTQARYRVILDRAAERLSALARPLGSPSVSPIFFKSLLSQWDKRRFPRNLEKSAYRKHLKRLVRECSQCAVPSVKQVLGVGSKGILREFEENGISKERLSSHLLWEATSHPDQRRLTNDRICRLRRFPGSDSPGDREGRSERRRPMGPGVGGASPPAPGIRPRTLSC